MAENLKNCLLRLHATVDQQYAGRAAEASNIIKDIVSICLDCIGNLAYHVSLLFNIDYGIVKFLLDTVKTREFENARADLLQFLSILVTEHGDTISSYATDLKTVFLRLLSQEPSTKVKVENFNLMSQLLGQKDSSSARGFDVGGISQRIVTAFEQSSRDPSTARAALYQLVGVLSERFPEYVTEKNDRIFTVIMSFLKKEMVASQKKPDQVVIAGCFRGLKGLLTNFTQSTEEGSQSGAEIYKYLKMAINSDVQYSRFDVPKAALSLFVNHASQFKPLLATDYKYHYHHLSVWGKRSNKDVKYIALDALFSYLEQVALYAEVNANNSSKKALCLEILEYLLTKFHGMLNADLSSPKDLSVAVKGYGYFSAACKALLKEDDVKFMFEQILQRSQHIYTSIEEQYEDKMEYLPGFLEALASIIGCLDQVSDVYLMPMEKMVLVLFESFPKFGKAGKFLLKKGMGHFLVSLGKNPSLLKSCLSHLVYQLVLRTCCHAIRDEQSLAEKGNLDELLDENVVSYKSYLDLWHFLLEERSYMNADLSRVESRTLKPRALVKSIFDELILSLLAVLKKLNLNLERDGPEQEEVTLETEARAEAVTMLKANVPKDFEILINLVDFARELLYQKHVKLFFDWIPTLVKDIIALSCRFPLVSGFYKLLEMTCINCIQSNYFENISTASEEYSDVKITSIHLRKYRTEVLGRIKQYKDDLLASCLGFLVGLPFVIVMDDIERMETPVKIGLKLGLSHLPLAEATLNGVERWVDHMESSVKEKFLQSVLPSFDDYLRVSNEMEEGSEEGTSPSTKPMALDKRKGRVPIRLIKALRNAEKSQESPVNRLRIRIIKFLGHLGGFCSFLIKDGRTPNLGKAVAWDTEMHLGFAVPFPDMKPTIYLDPFLPRVVELATSSSDRQTKVIACELLHALVLFMLGKNEQQSSAVTKQMSSEKVYRHVFPAVLQLGCDMEQVAEQLFRPLVMQLIHWFTSSAKVGSDETMVLLDAIFDGIVNPSDALLRDFCANCLREFLHWSIKQTSVKQMERNPINPKKIFKRLNSYAVHPNAFKRLGAAQAFNNIYRIFREEQSLVDVFALEMLIVFVTSLAIAHTDEVGLGTVDHCKGALGHIERIIKHKADLLSKPSNRRRVLGVFSGTENFTLHHVIPWLLKECGRLQTECRHRCMELVYSLSTCQLGVASPKIWMEKTYESNGAQFFTEKFEGGGKGDMGILKFPHLSSISKRFTLGKCTYWLESLLAALDCYTWIASSRILDPFKLVLSNGSNVLSSIKYFISEISRKSLQELSAAFFTHFKKSGTQDPFSSHENERFNRLKCTAVVRCFDLLTDVLSQNRCKELEAPLLGLFNADLFHVIGSCILNPESVGFEVTDIDILEHLPSKLLDLCKVISAALSETKLSEFIGTLSTLVYSERYDLIGHLPFDFVESEQASEKCGKLLQLIGGYQLLHSAKLLEQILKPHELQKMSSNILSSVLNGLPSLAGMAEGSLIPLQKMLADHMLLFYLLLSRQDCRLSSLLLDTLPLHHSSDHSLKQGKGITLYHLFQGTIGDYLMNSLQFQSIVQAGFQEPHLLNNILQSFLPHVMRKKQRSEGDRLASDIVKVIISSWDGFASWVQPGSPSELKVGIVNILKYIFAMDGKVALQHENGAQIRTAIGCLFSDRGTSLSFKCQVLDVLPMVLMHASKEFCAPVKDFLNGLVVSYFPLSSRELIPASQKYNEYMECLVKLLHIFLESENSVILEVLLPVIVRETESTYNEKILPVLISLTKKLKEAKVLELLDLTYRIFTNEVQFPSPIRKGVILRVCLPLFQRASTNSKKLFFRKVLPEVMRFLDKKYIKNPESSLESQLATNICCFKILHCMYASLSREDVMSPHSDIVKSFSPGAETGKELTQAATKLAHATKSEDTRGETVLQELRRDLHCAAFDALAAIIACTQTDQKFYTGFLFTENLAKGQLLLDNLVDNNRVYSFEVELTVPFARKRQLQAIRQQEAGKEEDDIDGQPRHRIQGKGFQAYLSSQYLMGSSLSQDVNQYDFNTPIQAYSSMDLSQGAKRRRSTESSSASDMLAEDEEPELLLERTLELDDLNQNSAMQTFISLLKTMKRLNVYKDPPQDQTLSDMPPWMTCLHRKLCANDTSLNVKLFIAKLIANEYKIFEPYGHHWFGPLIQMIVHSEIPGHPVSYFVVDLVVAMLSWSGRCIPKNDAQGKNMACGLLDYLIKHCHHTNRGILKNNLQLIKTLSQVWKDLLEIPYKLIYDKFSSSESDKKDNMTGIQLLGVVLTNGYPPFKSHVGVNEPSFFRSLKMNLTFKYRDIYASCAEVIGLALKYFQDHEEVDNLLAPMVHDQLLELHGASKEKFVTILHRIRLNYPDIVDKFMNQLLFSLPNLFGSFKAQGLDCIASRIESLPNKLEVYAELKVKGLEAILSHRDDETLLPVLQLIRGVVSDMSAHETFKLLASLSSVKDHPNPDVRERMFDLFMLVYDAYRADPDLGKESEEFEILKISKEVLLLGINDSSTSLSLKILNFWRHETRLPSSAIERTIEILRALYSPKTEKEFLNYSTNLILQLTSLSPDYCLPLFDKPLDATKKFQEVQINCSWQRQKAAMTPLFAISQVFSQTQSPDYDGSGTLQANMLRATETNFSFSQTEDKRGTRALLDWMSPSTQVEVPFFVPTRGTAESQSSLLVKQMQRKPRPKLRVSSPMASDEVDSGNQEKPEVLRLKRRFLKDQEASSKFFAKREVRKQEKRQQILERQKAARDHRVVMYRKYRTGELPDIQIKHSELIVPLQALAQHDSSLAQTLFVNIVNSLMEQLPEKLTPQVLEKAQSDIHSSLEVMISSSSFFFPPFVHAIEDICYRQKNISLSPVSVATASNMANKQPMGILMLERQLLSSAVTQSPKAKRRRGVQALSDASNTWTQLAKLYKSIEEYEFVRTIFGSQLSNSEVTQQAFAAEIRNDYREAAKLYNKALSLQSSEDDSFLLEEGEFLDHCRVKCYEHLCQWSNLLTLTLQGIDEDSPADISRIMDDALLQEQYLPSYIKSNVKLWCQGNEEKIHVSFTQFIESALQSEDTKEYMKSHFAEELALLSVLQNDNNRARYFLNLGVQSFLEDWSDLGHLLAKSRFSRLQKLQKLCELEEFLDLVSKGSWISVDTVGDLLERWSKRFPLEAMDSITVWDDVMLNRSVYFRKIREVYHRCPRTDGDGLDQKLKLEEAKYSLQIADVAREQGNLTVAFQYLMDAESSQSKTIKECLPVQWCHVYAKAQNDASKTASQEDAATILVKAIELLNVNKSKIAGDPSLLVNHNLLEREAWERLAKITSLVDGQDGSVGSLFGDKQQDVFMKYYHMTMKGDAGRCLSIMLDFSTRALQSAEAAANNLNPDVKSERDLHEKCLLTLVTYCNNKLNAEDTHEEMKNELADGCIRHLLKAMTLNSKAARQMFPCLLQIVELYPDTRETFKQKVEAVPEWMFLSWVNQMIALLDKEHGLSLEGILWRIAKVYPQSLIYPLKTSSEQFKFASDRAGKALEANFKKLSQQVANPACLLLIESLEQLTNPEHVFKDWREDVKPLLSAKERSPHAIKDAFMVLWKKLFCQVGRGKENGLDPGNVRRRFAKAYGSKVEQIFGKEGTALLKMSEKAFREKHEALFAEMKNRKAEWLGKGKPSSLKEFSPWLANFRSDKFMYPIEIPGQYTGNMKPLAEYHVKIVGFNEEIRSMESIRAPKRITVRGDDEREYKFLVKGGEDLRLDQRIEQLFGIMNGILAEDINSTSRGLQLKTYNVIPMTNRIGIIEWLDNTMPLKELLITSLTDKERTNSQNLSGIIPRHMSFSAKYGNILKMYSSATRKDVERAYDMLKNSVPWDLLRRSLENLSSSSEAYFLLRNNFIRTHSCLCVCHYIVGIGDRHLSNFLVDTTSGGVIGIDFGHAFGSATQLLPTPELMPFRLTPQITNLLVPLNDHGPFKETVCYVLQALRERPDLLLNTMDVFIKEPLLDWQVYARMQAQRISKSEEYGDSDTWYPMEKLRICKMKLDGINPAYITGEEIKGGKYGSKSGPIQAVAFGDRHCNIRRRLLDKADQDSSRATFSLSVEDQVACLLDLATDSNVIFRAYAGWEPWV